MEKVITTKEPSYNLKLGAIEAFFVLQLIDKATISGREAEVIGKIRAKYQKLLDNHMTKTGEYVGYPPEGEM